MSVELTYLTLTAALAASLWVPYIIGVNTQAEDSYPKGSPDGFVRPLEWRHLRPWVQRAYRAQQNLLEQAMPFAVLVLILDAVDGFTSLTAWICAAFFWIRVAHAVGYFTAWAKLPVRPQPAGSAG